MHKPWVQIEEAYIQSNRIFNYARLRLQGRLPAVWPALGAFGLLIALSGTLFLFNNPLWPVVCVTGTACCMMVYFRSLDRLLGRLYPQEYEQYAIARQRMSERCDYLAYALFLQRIKAMGHSPQALQALSDYSETLSQPPKPFLINQHFTTVIMVSILVSLLSAYLQKTPGWTTQALEYIATALGLTFVLSLGLDGLRVTQTRDNRIRRYLKRARIELEHAMHIASAPDTADDDAAEDTQHRRN